MEVPEVIIGYVFGVLTPIVLAIIYNILKRKKR